MSSQSPAGPPSETPSAPTHEKTTTPGTPSPRPVSKRIPRRDRACPGRVAARQGGSAGSPRPSAGRADSRSAGRDTTASDQAKIVSHSPRSATNIFAVK